MMDEQNLRLEILRIVHKAGVSAVELLAVAKSYYDYVTDGQSTSTKSTQQKVSTKK